MNQNQRKVLQRLMNVCNDMGGKLDRTSTADQKYIDRQQALGLVWKVIYSGVFGDHPDNDHRKEDLQTAEELLTELETLSKKTYKDRSGYIRNDEKHLL